ncbi:ADP-ribosylglycohydrolase family protein [uncultured Kordia sp.]|uniref:ADP-ribosylglycohydrolase family protein n=1 Tax=uncultured Kordia sp. TaxID=507699 RepID=UPI0026076DBB|nr:ADP-ribosylglycohydrolase family protein [uncultured Kordia sp.]
MNTHRLQLAQKSLLGNSIGDAFGESFFGLENAVYNAIHFREIPQTTWEFTDDTVMAIAIYTSLEMYGGINQDFIAKAFARNYHLDFNRGYGPAMHRTMRAIEAGENWKEVSKAAFNGMGSMGNGGAMRAGLIGAYFYDDLENVKEQAFLSSEITHANEEGCVGAIAVAVATAINTQLQMDNKTLEPNEFIKKVVAQLPDCDTTSKIKKSITVLPNYDIRTVVSILGNGVKMIAQDTVPISIWIATHHQTDFQEALWRAVSALGDRDTICAIVGAITIMNTKDENIPANWKNKVENWRNSEFYQKN